MYSRLEIAQAVAEVAYMCAHGKHYLGGQLLLGVQPTEDELEKAARELLSLRAAARQTGTKPDYSKLENRSHAADFLQ